MEETIDSKVYQKLSVLFLIVGVLFLHYVMQHG